MNRRASRRPGNSPLDASNEGKPAHAMLNIAAGEGLLRPPSNPRPVASLAEQRTRGGEAPEPRLRCDRG